MVIKEILRGFKSLFGGTRREVVMPLDPDKIKDNETIKALTQQKTARDAQLGKLLAEKHAEREVEKSKDKEKEIIEKLNQQDKEIKNKNVGRLFSLRQFFIDYEKGRRWKDQKLEITDREGKEVLGKFGDIAIGENDTLILLDSHKNPLARGKQLNQIIYKPEALANYIKRKQLPIPYVLDDDGIPHFVPDLDNLEHFDVSYNKRDNQYELTEEVEERVKHLLIKKHQIISKLRNDKERLENININLKAELDDAKSSSRVLENQSSNYKTQLSKAMDSTIQFETRVSNMQKEISTLRELKALQESTTFTLETINQALLKRVEVLGIRPQIENELNMIIDLIDNLKDKLPHTIIQNIESEKPQPKPVMPGKVIGQAPGA